MFICKLKNREFLEREYYKKFNFRDKNIPKVLSRVGLDNQGILLTMLYSLLAVPRKLYNNELSVELNNLNKRIKTMKHIKNIIIMIKME